MVIATDLTSIWFVYKEKIFKNDSSRINVASIQIQKDAIFHSERKKNQFNTKETIYVLQPIIIDFFQYLIFHLIFHGWPLDFRTILENMKMSPSLLEHPRNRNESFQINSFIINNLKYYEISTLCKCVDKKSMIIGCFSMSNF